MQGAAATPPTQYVSPAASGGVDVTEAFKMDNALVNLGTMLAQRVTGRISTEIDTRLARDTGAMVARGTAIMGKELRLRWGLRWGWGLVSVTNSGQDETLDMIFSPPSPPPGLYRMNGVAPDRILLRIPATWAGCQAMKQLERLGFSTQAVFVYSEVQALAAAQVRFLRYI